MNNFAITSNSANVPGDMGLYMATQAAPLPSCDCDVYMPPGQHDPYVHAAQERAAIEEANKVIEASNNAFREAQSARPACPCRTYMPSGQHEPDHHKPEDRAAISEANRIIAASRASQPGNSKPRGGGAKDAMDLLWKVRGKWAAKMRNSAEVSKLAETLDADCGGSTFTCGGSIPIASEKGKGKARAGQSHPVSIRWGGNGQGRLLTLPGQDILDRLDQLVQNCIPATFGRDGQDVYDESYRRAGALSTQDFMTDFCPYESGIIDIVTRLLLPEATDSVSDDGIAHALTGARGIRAELYKLNVYSAPSGFFKPHVDTPRSSRQIGSLVVCLPVPFQGGALVVRHQDQEMINDWSTAVNKEASIQWAAFYSDCEHEVLQVTAGHRITLTYNLFLAPSSGLLNGRRSNILRPRSLPLTRQLSDLLENPKMWPHGGYIGVHMAHSYPHTHEHLYAFVPQMLKGTDMAVYQAIAALGLTGSLTSADLDQRHLVLRDLDRRHRASKSGIQVTDTIDCDLQPLDVATDSAPEEGISDEYEPSGASSESDDMEFEDYDDELQSHFNEKREALRADRQICWLNDTSPHKELSRAFLAYGNQAELATKYTTIALIAKIPSWEERSQAGLGTRDEPMVVD